MAYHVSDARFRKLVDKALSELGEPFDDALVNMSIEIRDRPSKQDLENGGLAEDELLLGLYVGVPLTDRSAEAPPGLPDRIFIFKEDCEEVCDSDEDLIREVRITVLHELGHYFGLGEDELDDLGYG